MKWKETENPDTPLKGLAHRFSHLQMHTLGTGGGFVAWEVLETYGDGLNCVALEQGLHKQPPLFLCQASLQGSLQMGNIMSVLNPPPPWTILKLH